MPEPHPEQSSIDVTQLICAARSGDKDSERRLFEMVYQQLRALAAKQSKRYSEHTLDTTALVNEAYMQMASRFPEAPTNITESRATFYRTVALAMRTILRDYWRMRNAQKRGGGVRGHDLHSGMRAPEGGDRGGFDTADYLALDEALDALERTNARWYEVVLHRYFAGRTIEETAEMMGLSASGVKKYWRFAKAWLVTELQGDS
ncbi:MAG: sigma-70 family RNA polymerase sigma factor [Planctomycetes bacterium]|nr:sigma-70 family RNA polymerase sigma factor [Planctomycetota bacterium]